NRELQLVDDQFAFFVAAKIKTVHAKYAALFRIANDAQRHIDVFRVGIAVREGQTGAEISGPDRWRPGRRCRLRRLGVSGNADKAHNGNREELPVGSHSGSLLQIRYQKAVVPDYLFAAQFSPAHLQ